MRRSWSRRDALRAGVTAGAAVAAGPALAGIASKTEAGKGPGGFRLGLVTYNVARDWDLDTILRLCREAGVTGVEFRTTHRHGVETALSPNERGEVRRKIAGSGLEQVSLGSVCEFHAADPELVRKHVDDCRAWVALAKDIGARGVKVRPNGFVKGVPEEKTLEQIGKALATCGAFAREHGVEIWMEVHGEGTKLPKNSRTIMDQCGHASVGVTWNSNDTDVEGGSVQKAFDLLRPFIRCCHITDLGSAYPYAELFGLLRSSRYDRFTLCEFNKPVDPAEGAAWLRRYRERWEELQRA
jgi:sugar phosphate isomerase/epimerase